MSGRIARENDFKGSQPKLTYAENGSFVEMNRLAHGTETRSTRTFAEQASRVARTRQIFARHGVMLHHSCEIVQLMRAAEALAERDPSRPVAGAEEFEQMVRGAQFDRVSDAILMLDQEDGAATHLVRLAELRLTAFSGYERSAHAASFC